MKAARPLSCLLALAFFLSCGDGTDQAKATSLRLAPASLNLLEGETVAIEVFAKLDDGSERNVTSLANLQVSEGIVRLDEGKVHGERPGEGLLQATFEGLEATAETKVTLGDLTLEAEGEFQPGEEVKLRAIAETWGGEKDVTAEATFRSSDERIATVDADGSVTVLAGGEVRFEAELHGEKAELDAVVTCDYPASSRLLTLGNVFLPLSWRVNWPDGSEGLLALNEVHCNADWKQTKTIAFLLVAEWCGSCNSLIRKLPASIAELEAEGMMVFTVMLQDDKKKSASLDVAVSHVGSLVGTAPGPVTADAETVESANYFTNTRTISVFPTIIVVRTSDMKIIAKGHSATDLLDIAKNHEKL